MSILQVLLFAIILVFSTASVVNPILFTGTKEIDLCRDGSYAVTLPPFGACSGFRKCEPGHYCENEKRNKCPSGTFGSISGLQNASCSGLCAPGYYCPLASISSHANKCYKENGNISSKNYTISSVYCPEGSSIPLEVPSGYYSIDINGNDDITINTNSPSKIESLRVAIKKCPKGWYCPGKSDGKRFRCAGGTYGSMEGLDTSTCTGKCPAGYYCPAGSFEPYSKPCSSDPTKYCPIGSERPLPTQEGYYAVDYIKQDASSSAFLAKTISMGGFSATTICPAGSFCLRGISLPCPPGRYGSIKQSINPQCSGPCREGWYCPSGSQRRQMYACGTSPSVYCPISSGKPTPVSRGYYTHSEFASSVSANATAAIGEDHLGLRHTNQTICEAGYYCLKDGRRYGCPSGRYGATAGMTSTLCTGPCSPGYYCPIGSTSPTQNKCGNANLFCPEGSALPRIVEVGYYSTYGAGTNGDYNGPADVRSYERMCEPGFFCKGGNKFLCRSGHYGANYRKVTMDCDGPCDAGHYCPEGSISPTEVMCGGPDRFCPRNSSQPIFVKTGYYSTGLDDSRRDAETIAPPGHYAIAGLVYVCPAGYYGETEGLSKPTCTGSCLIPGWYCPTGSISPYMKECGGDDRYCPATTVAPVLVHEGFYTADYEYEGCPPGQFRANSTTWVDPDVPGLSDLVTITTRPSCELCPEGLYKYEAGDGIWLCRRCPNQSVSSGDRSVCICEEIVASGTFKHFDMVNGVCNTLKDSQKPLLIADQWIRNTSRTRSYEKECEAGHYCIDGVRYRCPVSRFGGLRRETRPTCQGPCATGYYCQLSSISPYSSPCGGANKICVEGSAVYELVPAGYYSNEDENELKRSTKQLCPKGYYCPGDGRRYQCPAGRYADVEGIISNQCVDVCDRGHYCTSGSPSPKQIECGSADVYCPRGSSNPQKVTIGYYGGFSGPDAFAQALWDTKNSTCSVEFLCEPGYFCKQGVKYPCPPGTFGWRYGMTSESCGGKCAAGYYCPSYLNPQPDAPSHTQWPRAPHTDATPLKCGGVSFLCPRGSFYPVLVGGGNYTVGGDLTNTTRTGQEICKAGTYCSDGIVNLCPKGRYGDTNGQSVSTCTGWCPPGHYCVAGTSKPTPCQAGYYSTGAAWACSACPGTRTTPLACQTSRECCFRGA
jgi:hypothetical protein